MVLSSLFGTLPERGSTVNSEELGQIVLITALLLLPVTFLSYALVLFARATIIKAGSKARVFEAKAKIAQYEYLEKKFPVNNDKPNL